MRIRFIKITLLTLLFAGQLAAQTISDANRYFYSDQFDKAVMAFEKLSKAAPADLNLQLQYGKALVAVNKNKEAVALYQQIATANPDDTYGQMAAARMLVLEGKEADAKKMMDKSTRKKTKDAALQRAAAESFMYSDKSNYNIALEYLTKSQEASTKDPATYMAFGDAYYELNEGGKAASNYEFAGDFDKTIAYPYYKVAKIYKRSKNNQFFISNLEKALSRNDKFSMVYRILGDFYYENAKYDKSKENYKKYLDLESGTFDDKLYYANLLYLTKDYQNTISYITDLQKQDDSKSYLYRLLGRSYYELGDSVKGLTAMTTFFDKTTPDKILASDYEYYAKLLLKNDKQADAITAFEKSIELDSTGENKKYYTDIAEMFFKQKNYADAAKYYNMKIGSMKNPSAQEYYELGISHYYDKNYADAEKAFSKVAELRPEAMTGHLWRAKTATKLEPDIEADPATIGSYGVAKPYYEKVAELAATDKEKYKKELIDASNYLSYYFYKKGDNESAKVFLLKTLEVDSTDQYASQLYKLLTGG
ncbi:MAG: tetratricopeptide repeat protein [Saprospiraceae bacterium]|nr:tetratricopeptide repeat protein [Saprospiraceae bacterium]MBP7699344.1 tetratricopeptide repeat protein [Saprospiraceae bacterium]